MIDRAVAVLLMTDGSVYAHLFQLRNSALRFKPLMSIQTEIITKIVDWIGHYLFLAESGSCYHAHGLPIDHYSIYNPQHIQSLARYRIEDIFFVCNYCIFVHDGGSLCALNLRYDGRVDAPIPLPYFDDKHIVNVVPMGNSNCALETQILYMLEQTGSVHMCRLTTGQEPVIERLTFFDANPVAVEYDRCQTIRSAQMCSKPKDLL